MNEENNLDHDVEEHAVGGQIDHVGSLFWSPSIMDDVFLFSSGRNHLLRNLYVRRWCSVPSPLIWPSTKEFSGTEKFATTGSVDGCSVLPETQFVWNRLCIDTTWVKSVGVSFPHASCRREARV